MGVAVAVGIGSVAGLVVHDPPAHVEQPHIAEPLAEPLGRDEGVGRHTGILAGMGLNDRYWDPIGDAEAAAVLGAGTSVVARHRRWLFAVARCRTPRGDVYLKRQPPMGRALDQLAWQHRLANHLADRGVPSARALGLVEHGGHWYEVHEPAAGDDVYTGADSWDPFVSEAHAASAGAALARLHVAGADFPDRSPQPQAGFVVQLGAVAMAPVEAVAALAAARPAVADYLAGRRWEREVAEAYDAVFDRLRPVIAGLPRLRSTATGRPTTSSSTATPWAASSTFTRRTTPRGRSTWRSRSSATASSGTGSRPATTVPTTSATSRR